MLDPALVREKSRFFGGLLIFPMMNIDYRYADTTLTPVEYHKMITSTLETFYHSRKTNLLPMIIPPLSYMYICAFTIFPQRLYSYDFAMPYVGFLCFCFYSSLFSSFRE